MAFQSRPAISSLNPQAVPAGSPSVTVTLNGTGFVPGSIVQWNGSARATTFVSSGQLQATIPASDLADPASVLVTVLNAPADGGLSASIPFTVDKVLTLIADLPANDIAWDPTRDLIYASLPGSAGASGNSIVTLDPATGAITSSVFIGSEPNRLAVSGNGQFLYVGVDGSSTLQRYTLPAMTQDLSIDLGSDPISGPYMAFDLQVEPGAPHTVAVSLGCAYSATSSGGAFIYDDATARPGSASGRLGAFFNSLQWGPDGTKLYATNAATSSWDYYILSVNAGGVSLVYDLPGAFTSYQNALLYDGTSHMLYSSSGLVLSPATGQVAGNFLVSGPLALDPAKVYFLNVDLDPSVLTIQSFDPVAHTPIATATVIPAPSTPLSFTPRRLLRRGPNGLVMGGGGTPIYFVSGPFAQ